MKNMFLLLTPLSDLEAWGTRSPLGVSFERAKETKTRLGRSPLSTPLGYEADVRQVYGRPVTLAVAPVAATTPGYPGQLALSPGNFHVRAYPGQAAFPPPGA